MVCTCVVGGTDAGVVVDSVNAGGVVLTVIVFTVIWVYLTTLALEAWRAHAAIHTHNTCKKVTGIKSENTELHVRVSLKYPYAEKVVSIKVKG